jgi:hypothetical protein
MGGPRRAEGTVGHEVRRLPRWVYLMLLAVAGMFGAPPTAADSEVRQVLVTITPSHPPPEVIVTVDGLTCGPGWSAQNLLGFEVTDVPDPPMQDEGVSIYARSADDAEANGITATFIIPEVAAGPYYFYYLCADKLGARVFEAVPPDGHLWVALLRPHPTAPPSVGLNPYDAAPAIGVGAIFVVILATSLIAVRSRPPDRR